MADIAGCSPMSIFPFFKIEWLFSGVGNEWNTTFPVLPGILGSQVTKLGATVRKQKLVGEAFGTSKPPEKVAD